MNTSRLNAEEVIKNNTATFVIPFHGDQEESTRYLAETIEGIYAQTDENWQIVIVDNASPRESDQRYLQKLEESSQKITLIRQKEDHGPGVGRNLGVEWAFKRESPIVLFNDADDISSPQRLKVVREIFLEEPGVDLVYSSFRVIDEHGNVVPRNKITPSILEIMDTNENNPVEGYNAWIQIGTVTGFACLPSSTSVRTSIAYECLAPNEIVSEDSYVWMCIAAKGNAFKFAPAIPSLYRIPGTKEGSTHRSRVGRKRFYEEKARVDTNGFMNALNIALEKGTIASSDVGALKAKFFERLIETLMKENEVELAQKIMQEALPNT